MKIRSVLLLLLTMLGAPRLMEAQDHPPHGKAEGQVRHGPVEMLLRSRDRLGLDSAQVVRLQEISRRMEERNRPIVTRLLEMRRKLRAEFQVPSKEMTPAQREEFHRRLEDARPLMREIRENNRTAMREVGEVLTPAQKDAVRAMLKEHRKERGSTDERHRRGHPL